MGEKLEETRLEISFVDIQRKGDLTFAGLRGRHQYSDQCSSRIRACCVSYTAVRTEGKEDHMARWPALREMTEEGINRERLLKNEQSRVRN